MQFRTSRSFFGLNAFLLKSKGFNTEDTEQHRKNPHLRLHSLAGCHLLGSRRWRSDHGSKDADHAIRLAQGINFAVAIH